MADETQNNKQSDASNIDDARERLMQEIAGESSITPPAQAQPKKEPAESEKAFMDFVEQKSTELPEDTLKEKREEQKQEDTEEKQKKRKGIIRTYYSDIAETIRNSKISLTRMAMAEDRRRAQETQQPKATIEKSGGKNIALSVISALLLIGAGVLLAFLFIQFRPQAPVATTPQNALMRANSTVTVDTTRLTRDTFLDSLEETKEAVGGVVGDVINVMVIETVQQGDNQIDRLLAARELLALLEADADAAFLRSVEEPFMLGMHILGQPHYFLILKTSFFENAFAGMLRWEERIASELPFLVRTPPTLPAPVSDVDVATTSITTLPVPEVPEAPNVFTDVVIANRDVRARLAADGEYDILYTFPDPETLIITTDTQTLRTVLQRLTVSRFER